MEYENKTREELIEEVKALEGKHLMTFEKAKELRSQLTTVRNMHQMLLRVNSTMEFFQSACDLLSQLEPIKFVWIGRVDSGSYNVTPAAQSGDGSDYLSAITIAWDDSLYGSGTVGNAIRSGKLCVVEDIESDTCFEPWKEEALKRGYFSTVALPLRHEGEVIGVIQLYSWKKDAFKQEELDFLTEVSHDITIGIRSFSLEGELQQKLEHVQKTLSKTVEAITRMTEIRDPYTSGHQQRVAKLACAIAKEMSLSKQQIEGIRVTGLLHDIGKIAVPVEILTKPGRLSEFEFNIIKTHPNVGYEIVKGIEFPWPVAQAVLEHHERFDGSGYPAGLSGEKIILEAKILGVADVVEAMSSHRPYRPALGLEKALEEILQKRGLLYDPNVVDSCERVFKERLFDFDK